LVPLRAGIHLGDIVVEKEGVYGDGVNVASRIEQLADAGSVVITQPVYDSIRNHRKFRVKYLGTPKLKNVLVPTRVYALKNPGLVVPERLTKSVSFDLRSLRSGISVVALILLSIVAFGLYRVLGKQHQQSDPGQPEVAVHSLRNLTGDNALGGLGELAAIQISHTLKETGRIIVLQENVDNMPVPLILQGAYYKAQDMIIYQAMLVNGKTGEIQEVFDPQTAPISHPETGLPPLLDDIMGYLLVGQGRGIYVPKYSAYQDYKVGLQQVFIQPDKAIVHFKQALDNDSEFNLSRLGLSYAYILNGEDKPALRELQKLGKSKAVSGYETQMIQALNAMIESDFQSAYTALVASLDEAPDPEFVRIQAATIALEQLQRPRTALTLLDPMLDRADMSVHHDWAFFLLLQRIYMSLHRYDQLVTLTESLLEKTNSDSRILMSYVRALCRTEQLSVVHRLSRQCADSVLSCSCSSETILYIAAVESALMGDSIQTRNFTSRSLGLTPPSDYAEALLFFIGGHFNTSASLFKRLATEATDSSVWLDLSIKAAIARTLAGDTTLALQMVHHLKRSDIRLPDGNLSYQQARLHIALGDMDIGLKSLELAKAQGLPERYGYFHEDVFIRAVFNDHRFRRMMESRD
jgi:tetratricopeptide (TPR) repeat protein